MVTDQTRAINSYQKDKYEKAEIESSKKMVEMYSDVFERLQNRETIRILDIGGGSGLFGLSIKQHCEKKLDICVHVSVLDNTKYDLWDEYTNSDDVKFIVGSAYEMKLLFPKSFFDVIFINRTLHHLVFDRWSETLKNYNRLFMQIYYVLKDDGVLCVTEETVESYIKDRAASYIIYKLTSCTIGPVVSICRKLDGKSAGVGVCFLSDKSWKNLYIANGFTVEYGIAGVDRRIKLYWRVLLLLKAYFFYKGYVLRKIEVSQN